MTKMRSRLALAAVSLIVPLVLPFSAQAGEFVYNNQIGKVYVKNVTVENIGEKMRYSIAIHTPVCPNQYHVEGWVQLVYKSPGGGWFRTVQHGFSGSDEENVDRTYTGLASFSLPDSGGEVNVKTNSECIYHGIRHGGIRLPW
jgi:hypothetical protein